MNISYNIPTHKRINMFNKLKVNALLSWEKRFCVQTLIDANDFYALK